MAAMICGTGSAFGNHYTTCEMKAAFRRQRQSVGDTDCDLNFADRVFDACGFDSHSVALQPEDLFRRMSREEYLQRRTTDLLGLANAASEKALEMWGGDRQSITHLLWGTMTGGMQAPTIDILLSQKLGLSPDVQLISVEGMGCLTGFRLLNLAQQLVRSQPAARILVVDGELRSSIGNSLPARASRTDIVSACLFRDAASAALVTGGNPKETHETPCFEIICGKSRILADTQHLAHYYETDDGSVCLHLDKELPCAVGAAEPGFIRELLEEAKEAKPKAKEAKEAKEAPGLDKEKTLTLAMSEVDIACHTGGPRILKEVAQAAGVGPEHMEASWAVMRANGNISGASNLAVLDHHHRCVESPRKWVIGLAMGPGICMEGVLLRRLKAEAQDAPLAPRSIKDKFRMPRGSATSDVSGYSPSVLPGHVLGV